MKLRLIGPFGDSQFVRFRARGRALGAIAEKVSGQISSVMKNGRPLSDWRDYHPLEDDELLIHIRPGDLGPLGIFILQVVAGALIRTALSFALSALFSARPKSFSGGEKREEIFGLAGYRNLSEQGVPEWHVYGKNKIHPTVIGSTTDIADDGRKMEFGILSYCGLGPIQSLSDWRINGSAIADLGVTVETRLGATPQTVLAGFENVSQVFSDNREVVAGGIVYTTRSSQSERLRLIFHFPGGLFRVNKRGHQRDEGVRIKIEYKKNSDPTFTEASTVEYWGNTRSAFFRKFEFDPGSKDTWDVKPTLLADHIASPGDETWVSTVNLFNVEEITFTTETYDGVALAALRGLPNSQINSIEGMEITAVEEGIADIPVWNGAAFVDQYTRKRLWIARDLLTNPKRGLGTRFPASLHDDDAALLEQNYLDESVAGHPGEPSETRDLCDLIVNDRKGGLEWLKDHILGEIGASYIPTASGKIKPAIYRDRTAQMLFSMPGNVIEDSVRTDFALPEKSINIIGAGYYDEAKDWNFEVSEYPKREDVSGDLKPMTLSYLTIKRSSQALRLEQIELNKRQLILERYNFRSPRAAQPAEPFDVHLLRYDTAKFKRGWGGYLARESTVDTLVLDREVALDAGKTYEATVIQRKTNASSARAITTGAGKWGKASLVSGLSFTPARGDIWAIGEQNVQIVKIVVDSVKLLEDGNYEISALRHDPIIFSQSALPARTSRRVQALRSLPPLPLRDAQVSEEIVLNSDGSTRSILIFDVTPGLPVVAGLAQGGAASTITLAANEPVGDDYYNTAKIKIVDGTGAGQERTITDYAGSSKIAAVDSAWSTIPDATSRYEIRAERYGNFWGFRIDVASTISGPWTDLYKFAGTRGEIDGRGQEGTEFFRFIPFNAEGIENQTAAIVRSITLTGDTSAPAAPSGLVASVGTGKLVELRWNANADLDLDEYQVWRSQTNDSSTASKIAEVRSNKFLDSDVTLGQTYYYWIKAVDRSENVSVFHPGQFAGVQAIPVLIPNTEVSTDAPEPPTSLAIAGSGVYLSSDGSHLAFVTLEWINPSDPKRAYIDVLYRKNTGNPDWLIADQLTGASTRIDDLTPGVAYDFAVRAVSKFGVPSTLNTLSNQTAPSDTTAPAAPASVTMSSFLKEVTVEVAITLPVARDFAGVEIEIYRTTIGGTLIKGGLRIGVTQSAAGSGTILLRKTVELAGEGYGSSIIARARSLDYTGNESAWTNAASGTTLTEADRPDLQDGAVSDQTAFSNDGNVAIGPPGAPTEVEVGTMTISTSGRPVVLTGSAHVSVSPGTSNGNFSLRIRRDTTSGLIVAQGVSILVTPGNESDVPEVTLIDGRDSGSRTFKLMCLDALGGGSAGNVSNRRFKSGETVK